MWGGFSLLVVEQNGHKFLVISVNLLALLAGNNWEECMSASAPAQLCVPTGRAVRRCWAARPPCHRVLVLYKAWQQLGFSSIETSFQHGGLSAGRGAMGAVRAQWMPGQQVRSFIPGFNADNKTKQKKEREKKKVAVLPAHDSHIGHQITDQRHANALILCPLQEWRFSQYPSKNSSDRTSHTVLGVILLIELEIYIKSMWSSVLVDADCFRLLAVATRHLQNVALSDIKWVVSSCCLLRSGSW